jgi:hypothetical protein
MSSATIIVPASNAWPFASSMEQGVASPLLGAYPQKFIVKFSEVECEHVVISLWRPLEMLLQEVAPDDWACEEPTFSLFARGKSSAEAVCSCFEDFAVLWEEVGQASDEDLSGDAQRAKRALVSLVKSVKSDR